MVSKRSVLASARGMKSEDWTAHPGSTYHNRGLNIKALDFSTRGTIIGFGMDQGDPGLGTASRQEIGRETRPVIDVMLGFELCEDNPESRVSFSM
jgi:hypothetical protein